MANIQNELNNIKNALFGQEVRGSIHDGIDAINKEVESTTSRQVDLESTFDQLIINAGNSNAEIVDARVKADGTSYSKLGDRLDSVDSQLEHIENNVGNTGIKNGGRTSQVMVSFTDDDCNIEAYTILKPLLDSKGIKATFAIPTGVIGTEGFMNESQVKELYNDGHDFMWHGHNLINFTQVSQEQLKKEYDASMKKIREWGIKPFTAVAYPQGSTNSFIRSFACEFFKCGIDVWRGWVNKVPYPQYMMSRIHFGEPNNQGMKEHLDSPYDTNTLEFYKYCVDKAIEDGQWLIFMTHAWYESFDETQRQYLLDIIDYIKSKNIEIVTISEGIEKTGNLLTAGDRTPLSKTDGKYFNIGSNGEVDSNMIDVYIAQPDRYTSSHQPWEFEKGKVTKNLITYYESTVRSYPGNTYGVLITDTTATMNNVKEQVKECIRQTFIANTTGIRYTRNSNSDGTKWTKWKEEDICYISDKDTFDCTMLPNKFPLDKIIYNVITPTKVSQSPESYPLGQYGILTTYTTGISWDGYTNYEMMRQEYVCQTSGLKYFRMSNNKGTGWTEWKQENITQWGSTQLRPTKNVQIGQMYFDYTLQKPIWCNQITPTITWCDATGTVV